jgi:DNA-binding NarL/FixJ family response regulator
LNIKEFDKKNTYATGSTFCRFSCLYIELRYLTKTISMRKTRLLIADDHKLFRESCAICLNTDERFDVIATGRLAEAVEFTKIHKPDIVLLDIPIPPSCDIVEIGKIRTPSGDSTRVIGVSVFSKPGIAKRAFQLGVWGYLTKNSSREEMITAILAVQNGEKFICQEIKNILSATMIEQHNDDPDISVLTDRELDIIKLIKEGQSSKEIACSLRISRKTVEVHRHHILKKLKMKNSAALVNFINSSSDYLN